MKVIRRFTKPGQDALKSVEYEVRNSRISNPDGSVVFEMKDALIPKNWSQLATDIMVSKYFRKAGVPQRDAQGNVRHDEKGNVVTGPEHSVAEVVHRLAGCWRFWGEKHGYFDTPEDAQVFYDEIAYMMLNQMCAPNSPQWFNTGLNWAYGISGPAQGHLYCEPATGELKKSDDAYSHPQPHACFIQSINDDLVNEGGIMDLWVREARLFKYGSGTGTNFSRMRGENEPLSGGGKSSGLMSFLKIGDRAAGAIKSGGTTRRAAKMCCLDLDHPDIESFVNWKVREEIKVSAMVEGMKLLPKEHQDVARRLGLKLDYDFNGEAYATVSGQNSNNSVRIPNSFFHAVEKDGDWNLTWRTSGKISKKLKARDLWDQIAFAAWRCADPGVQFDDAINQWHTCPKSGRINASNPCVTADTRVLCGGGVWRRIDQMLHIPTRVLTNVDSQQVHPTDGAFPTGLKEVFEIRTACGYSLKLTGDHKVWTRSRGWVAAAELLPGDELRLPSTPAGSLDVGEPNDAHFFQLVGLLLSSANNDAMAIHLDALNEPALVEELIHYITTTWGHPNDEDEADGFGSTLTTTTTHRRLLARLKACIHTDQVAGRRVGDELFTVGLPAQKHALRALFTADAEIRNSTIELSGPLSLMQDVQMLLLGFGVQSGIFSMEQQSGRLSDRQTAPLRSGRWTIAGGAGDSTDQRDAETRRHGLRIDSGSLRSFSRHIGLLPGKKARELASILPFAITRDETTGNFDRFESIRPLGLRHVYDITEPATHSFVANGLTVHNCSEYMFLDDTACNLASLNVLTFFDADGRRFDIEGYKHAIRLWTVVLEISVLMASFPSENIARLSYKFRTLGLGYANLGAMLLQAGIPYDSEKGRAICAALTSILTGESYATSAELARQHGPFAGYEENKSEMLRVIRNHRRAAYNITANADRRGRFGDYEAIEIKPVGIDAAQFTETDPLASQQLLKSARECWDRALLLGEMHGYRNAQTTVIAPTGTIGLLMDCDTTGVEPDFALVKFKKLAGGGYFKIANQSVEPALRNLGYSDEQIGDILTYVMGTLSLDDSPHVNRTKLLQAGFTASELSKIEEALPGSFELSFAFSPWSLGAETLTRLGVPDAEWKSPNFNLLRRLGFSKQQIDEANDVICGRSTVEGAPHLKPEHLPVFDCANNCGKHGKRYIHVDGHIRMMAAAQPFITGAISKTINLPNDASVDDIKNAYILSWRLGLKANALYRDGSKLSQPLNVKSDEDLEKKSDEDDEDNVAAAKDEVASEVAKAAVATGNAQLISVIKSDNLTAANIQPIEKIVERIVERPLRRRLPDTRRALTHKFDVQGHEGYVTVGLYDDGNPGEVFITMAKEGSTIGGLMDTIATLVSVALQYGVPVESLVRKFEHVRFEPSGMTRNPEIPIAKSLVDYIFRWLAMEFIPGYRAANAPKRPEKKPEPAPAPATQHPALSTQHSNTGSVSADAELAPPEPALRRGGNGNGGHGHGHDSGPSDSGLKMETKVDVTDRGATIHLLPRTDPLSKFSSEMQADAPACDVCGSITVRSGTCYKCLNCGSSMGCS